MFRKRSFGPPSCDECGAIPESPSTHHLTGQITDNLGWSGVESGETDWWILHDPSAPRGLVIRCRRCARSPEHAAYTKRREREVYEEYVQQTRAANEREIERLKQRGEYIPAVQALAQAHARHHAAPHVSFATLHAGFGGSVRGTTYYYDDAIIDTPANRALEHPVAQSVIDKLLREGALTADWRPVADPVPSLAPPMLDMPARSREATWKVSPLDRLSGATPGAWNPNKGRRKKGKRK